MHRCRRVLCCGGNFVFCLFYCTGCGGSDPPILGTEPHTGLQPDEEVFDPEPPAEDPPLPSIQPDGSLHAPSTASESSDDEPNDTEAAGNGA